MNSLIADLRFGLRMLLKKPVFTLVVVITLALGIGANTAIFSVVNAVLLRALPVENPDRLVMVFESRLSTGANRWSVAPRNFLTWKAQQTGFEEMVAFLGESITMVGKDGAEVLQGARISGNPFNIFRVVPSQGRAFRSEEDRPGG
jgi:putative ABC transport system permease protein